MKLAKQRSGGLFGRRYGGPLWQPGYYERVLRAGDDGRTVAAYIVSNPVRAGLVREPKDYPLTGSDVWPLDALVDWSRS